MIALIAAVADNNVIGSKNDLPWYLPEDLKRFKELTSGHVVMMGRKTYESILMRLGKPLPNRKSVVITRQVNYEVAPGVEVWQDMEKALAARAGEDVFIIGGGEIFNQSIDLADTLYITRVHKNYDGDVLFPDIDPAKWQKKDDQPHDGFSFATYQRVR